MNKIFEIGDVVESVKGRDVGGLFAIVGKIDEDFVLIADGATHPLKNPKKKNIKHLKHKFIRLDSIADKLGEGKKVFDSELKSALRTAENNEKEIVCQKTM